MYILLNCMSYIDIKLNFEGSIVLNYEYMLVKVTQRLLTVLICVRQFKIH